MGTWKPDIFEHLDYRAYLRAFYEAGKANTRVMSFRYLARRSGFSSPSYLRYVMYGERNLGQQSVEQLAEALDLNSKETEFFRLLVRFNQSEDAVEKSDIFEKVTSLRRFRKARRIDGALFEYLSHWYCPAIREMAARPDFETTPEWIASKLLPPIRPSQAKKALKVLFELGLLKQEEDGSVSRGEPTLSTEHEVRSLAIGNYHRQMLERAAESITLIPRDYRDLAAMTVCISQETISELKKRVHRFREQLLDLCDRDDSPEVVFQINTQLFPLTDPERE